MNSEDPNRTRPTLLRCAADWRNVDAWRQFYKRYDPYLRNWCREYRLGDDLAEEIRQDFWIALAKEIQSFSYNSNKRFRGWLRRRFHWRVVDELRARKRHEGRVWPLDDPSREDAASLALRPPGDEEEPPPWLLRLLELAEQVEANVRGRTQPRNWQVFWYIEIDGWTTREAADAVGMSYLAAHAAHRRVRERLALEGRRRLADLEAGSGAWGASPS